MVSGVALLRLRQRRLARRLRGQRRAPCPASRRPDPEHWNRLFRNDGDGRFADVTEAGRRRRAGATTSASPPATTTTTATPTSSWPDCGGTRSSATTATARSPTSPSAAGLARPDPEYGTLWAVAAAFVDYDRDGRLDLFVSNYCVWDPEPEPRVRQPRAPRLLPSAPVRGPAQLPLPQQRRRHLHRRLAALGHPGPRRQGHGHRRRRLRRRRLDGRLRRQRHRARLPVPEQPQRHASPRRPSSARWPSPSAAQAVSGMGADARDVDNDGRPDIFETALANETFPLFRNLGRRRVRGRDHAARASACASRARSGWGNGIVDLNNDGWKDLFVACARRHGSGGRLPRARAHGQRRVRQPRERPLRRRQRAGAGEAFARKAVHRGAAFGDLDNDGRVDVVVTALDGALELWRNVSPAPPSLAAGGRRGHEGQPRRHGGEDQGGHRLAARSTATSTPPSATAAPPTGASTSGWAQTTMVRELTITWPSGKTQTLVPNVAAGPRSSTVREPELVGSGYRRRLELPRFTYLELVRRASVRCRPSLPRSVRPAGRPAELVADVRVLGERRAAASRCWTASAASPCASRILPNR